MSVKKVEVPDLKIEYPKTRAAALKLIAETFKENEWNISEQNWFVESLGLKGNWKEFDNEKLKIIIEDFISLKMVLFK